MVKIQKLIANYKYIITLILIILILILIIVNINVIIAIIYNIHLYLNSKFRYFYKDNKESTTGYWSAEQRKTSHRCSEDLANFLINYYKNKNAKSVIDIGCGDGSYVYRLRNNGINAYGVDNNNTNNDLIRFDLSEEYINPKEYVQSFEVGEHIPKKYEDQFFDNICNNAERGIIMSWALPGQGGDGHVNELPVSYVIKSVEMRGFKLNKIETKKIRESITRYTLSFIYFRYNLLIFDRI